MINTLCMGARVMKNSKQQIKYEKLKILQTNKTKIKIEIYNKRIKK